VALLEGDEIAPGAAGWAQLRLRAPLVVARGDRFIVRVPSPSQTVGGGAIVETRARRHRRRDPAVLARLELLARGDPEEVALAALRDEARASGGSGAAARTSAKAVGGKTTWRPGGYGGRTVTEVEQTTGLPREEVAAALEELVARGTAVRAGTAYLAGDEWARLRADSARLLADHHRQYPLRPGMPREEWRSRLGLVARLAGEVAAALVAAGELEDGSIVAVVNDRRTDGGVNAGEQGASDGAPSGVASGGAPGAVVNDRRTDDGVNAVETVHGEDHTLALLGRDVRESHGALVRAPGHAPRLTPTQEQAVAAMLARFRREPFAPPTRPEVEEVLGAEVTAMLIEQGRLVKLNDAILLDRDAYAEAVRRVMAHLRAHTTLTVAEARDLLGTTRKYMLAIFEHLDDRRITRRNGDDRLLGPNAPPAAP
jgi:hypothetical protein